MTETYDQYQIRMIRDARRAQRAADGDFARAGARITAPRPLKDCQQCYDVGKSAGIEWERAQRRPWYTYGICVLLGIFLGLLIAAAMAWVHAGPPAKALRRQNSGASATSGRQAGRWHFVGF